MPDQITFVGLETHVIFRPFAIFSKNMAQPLPTRHDSLVINFTELRLQDLKMELPSVQLVWNFKTFTHEHNLTSYRIKQPFILLSSNTLNLLWACLTDL